MTHYRKIIRDAVANAIKDANTAAQDRVWASREPPIDVETTLIEEGPVILVYTRNDRTAKEGYSGSGRQDGWVQREVTLFVEVTAAGRSVVDDKLDAIAEQVETLLDKFDVPDYPAIEIRHVETVIETTQEFEQPLGGALIEYEACYWRQVNPQPEEVWPHLTEIGVAPRGDAPEYSPAPYDCSVSP